MPRRDVLRSRSRRSLLLAAAAATAGLGWAAPARAATVTVPGMAPTIQAAINAAANGDTISVAPGVYAERIDFHGKSLALQSSSGNPASTIIDGGAGGVVVTITGSAQASVQGLTIRNGRHVFDRFTYGYGSGVACTGSTCTLANDVISGNVGNVGIGVAAVGGGSLTVTGCTVLGNASPGSPFDYVDGGGIYASGLTQLTVSGSTIGQTSSPGYVNGGGVGVNNTPVVVLTGNTITGNLAGTSLYGGSVLADVGIGSVTATGNTFSNNSAGAEMLGGGLYVGATGPLVATGNVMSGNTANGYVYGGGLYVGAASSSDVEGNTVTGNGSATWGVGAGICFESDTPVTLFRNVVANNHLTGFGYGGGVFVLATASSIVNNTVADNALLGTGTYGYGGGLELEGAGPFLLENNVVVRNFTTYDQYVVGAGVDATYAAAATADAYSDVCDNGLAPADDYALVTPGPGDLCADPLFGAAYALTPASPCVNTGDPASPVPPGGGPRVDQGAIELLQACLTYQAEGPSHASDATIQQQSPSVSFGGLPVASSGQIPGSYTEYLLRWNLAAVPPGATVTSASVTLHEFSTTPATVNVHRVLAPWAAGTVTWNSFGAAYAATPSASFTSLGSGFGTVSFDITTLAAGWVSGATPNDGMLLEQSPAARTFYEAATHPNASWRPELQICYWQ